MSKENEVSYVEVDDRDTSIEVHYYHKGGRKMLDYRCKKRHDLHHLNFPGLLSNFHWLSCFPNFSDF